MRAVIEREQYLHAMSVCERVAELDRADRDRAYAREDLGRETVALVERLLAFDPQPGTGHGEHAAHGSVFREDVHDAPTETPARIGRYRVIDKVGEGGSGVVFSAVQDGTDRVVALKVLRLTASADAQRRLRAEGRILARLDHPGIARVLEAGTARVGAAVQCFLSLEFVAGEPLAKWSLGPADQARRVEILLGICEAVGHAHQRGVVHRDLKPGNVIVVTRDDGTRAARVLDFGIARLMGDEVDATRHTSPDAVLGTVGYMSPEQLDGDLDAIDTRTDVYALGLIAYEMLSGQPGFDPGSGSTIDRMRRVRSTRPTPLGRVAPHVSPDLATIVMKAIADEPDRRYDTASSLAHDLRRFVEGRPIEARNAGALYVARCFARRHRTASAVALLAAFSLLVALAATSWGLTRARRAADELLNHDRESLVLAARISSLLDQTPGTREARRVLLTELVGRLDPMADGSAQPELREVLADAIEQLSLVEFQSGEFDGAWALRRQLVVLRKATVDPDLEQRRDLARAQVLLGDVDHVQGEHEIGDALYREAHAALLDLADEFPAHVGVLDDLQWSHERLGHAAAYRWQDMDAVWHHLDQRAARIDAILAIDPTHVHARRGRAALVMNTPVELRPPDHEARLVAVVDDLRDLAAEHETDRNVRVALLTGLKRLAQASARDRAERARRLYNECERTVELLATLDPGDPLNDVRRSGLVAERLDAARSAWQPLVARDLAEDCERYVRRRWGGAIDTDRWLLARLQTVQTLTEVARRQGDPDAARSVLREVFDDLERSRMIYAPREHRAAFMRLLREARRLGVEVPPWSPQARVPLPRKQPRRSGNANP